MRVVDLGHAVAGPFCAYQLGLLGAEVIKVEVPEKGDALRGYTDQGGFPGMSAPFIAANAGKRSITVNLKSEGGREVLERLIQRADALVENFRPGVAERMGVGWDQARALNPRLVYCSISGFGQTGQLRDWTAYDNVIQAFTGMMYMNAEPGGEPAKVGFPVADVFSGLLAAYAIVAALLQRERGGPDAAGQYVDLSMADAMMVLMNMTTVTYLLGGEPAKRMRNSGFSSIASSGTFKTRDGYITIAANHQHQLDRLFKVLGAPETLRDPRFIDHASRLQNGPALHKVLVELFQNRAVDELEAQLAAEQVPASKVRGMTEVIAHPHMSERGIFLDTALSGLKEEGRVVGAGFRFENGGPCAPESAPVLGEHTDAVLRELGFDADGIAKLKAARAV